MRKKLIRHVFSVTIQPGMTVCPLEHVQNTVSSQTVTFFELKNPLSYCILGAEYSRMERIVTVKCRQKYLLLYNHAKTVIEMIFTNRYISIRRGLLSN